MPLLDNFRPPLSQRRHWDSFHGAWAEAIALALNQSLLPERFVAEARVKLGGQVEIDVGTFAEIGSVPPSEAGGVATWAPPKPVATSPLDFQDPDVFEVQVLSEEEGPRLAFSGSSASIRQQPVFHAGGFTQISPGRNFIILHLAQLGCRDLTTLVIYEVLCACRAISTWTPSTLPLR
jgi:hypothetical protein